MPAPKKFFHKYLTIFLSHEIKIAVFSLLCSVIGPETRPTSHQLDAVLIEIRRLTISAFKQLRCIHFKTRNLFEIFSFIPIGY